LIAKREIEREEEVVTPRSNIGSNINIAKPPTFNKDISKVLGFFIIYRLYIRMKIRNALVEK